ncbi:hypothetical protein [Wolbachia endosymbiont (group B) of Rhopobota naevana]|uniref:hypothetical protein n=1 Tax=Wolbachia endosymbiont (group B) of Rhopobota naevana TaxID=2954054 RepID=UPI00222699B2|nr:hypothetical protein [Wolbachia endosymbiont (group B) of Rhopobota naevana]
MPSSYSNFKKYVKFGDVPTKSVGCNKIPQNSFYKSVYLINSVVGPVKNVALGSYKKNLSMIGIITFALASVILQPLYLALAYLSYWPAKGLAKVVDSFDLKRNTKSLIDYSSMLSCKAWDHSSALSKFVNAVLNYAVSAVIWAAALVVTPLVWTIDKVASKFSDAKSEGVGSPSFSK